MPPVENPAERELLTKVRWICERIVRGQHAPRTYKVKWYRTQLISSAILSALAGAGILTVQQVRPTSDGNLITVGAILAVFSGVLTGVYQVLGIEKAATFALSCEEAFRQLHAQLENAVANESPVQPVNSVIEQAKEHFSTYILAIKLRNAPEAEVDELFRAVIKDHPVWNFPSPARSSKGTRKP